MSGGYSGLRPVRSRRDSRDDAGEMFRIIARYLMAPYVDEAPQHVSQLGMVGVDRPCVDQRTGTGHFSNEVDATLQRRNDQFCFEVIDRCARRSGECAAIPRKPSASSANERG